jgi:hypothetical protein
MYDKNIKTNVFMEMYIKTNEQTDKNQKSNQKTVNLPLVKSRR